MAHHGQTHLHRKYQNCKTQKEGPIKDRRHTPTQTLTLTQTETQTHATHTHTFSDTCFHTIFSNSSPQTWSLVWFWLWFGLGLVGSTTTTYLMSPSHCCLCGPNVKRGNDVRHNCNQVARVVQQRWVQHRVPCDDHHHDQIHPHRLMMDRPCLAWCFGHWCTKPRCLDRRSAGFSPSPKRVVKTRNLWLPTWWQLRWRRASAQQTNKQANNQQIQRNTVAKQNTKHKNRAQHGPLASDGPVVSNGQLVPNGPLASSSRPLVSGRPSVSRGSLVSRDWLVSNGPSVSNGQLVLNGPCFRRKDKHNIENIALSIVAMFNSVCQTCKTILEHSKCHVLFYCAQRW